MKEKEEMEDNDIEGRTTLRGGQKSYSLDTRQKQGTEAIRDTFQIRLLCGDVTG